MHLDSSAIWILRAVCGGGVLSLVMMVWMTAVRLPAMRKAGLTYQDAAHTEDFRPRLPSPVRRVADNYNHLFEAPTVFYTVAIVIVVAGLADPAYAIAAWIYLGLRVCHSLVQATIDRVTIRANLYALSWLVLGLMILRATFDLSGGRLPG
ncbi:hypothetical protein QO010_004516 [Caulobacter ginsengisoli]|uniref:MAPEG family protein n=1 Tax=Caulobacter ginsengisoli TaxID=400775 RepID=A0ABU0IXJ6_9CAUL|nr:MAPEG family protein [Caulobacter ginsengisoli]MDQ0466720.1 hypothetical protein [Caulobacter ginsengisoli]